MSNSPLRIGPSFLAKMLSLAIALATLPPARRTFCEPPPVPQKLSVENAAQLVGKPATLEIKVAMVKFAQRRKLHFLSSTNNFRSKENLAVAIRDADLPRFRAAGINDLQARFEGQAIRARGKVIEDEGQVLLLIAGPEAIELTSADVRGQAVKTLVVVTQTGEKASISLPLPADWPRLEVHVEHEGARETYRGVLLSTVLEKAGVPLGAEVRGPAAARYLIVTAADNYAALLSVPEVDPFFTDQQVLLGETLDGAPLNEKNGPLQLVVPGDKRRRRWVSQIARVELYSPLTPAPPVAK